MVIDKERENKERESLKLLLANWVAWLHTRNFYCAPVPKNILARMMKIAGGGEPPDADNSALCSAFNLVMQQAHEKEPDLSIPFMHVYLKQYRPFPLKKLAYDMDIDTDTIYQRAHKVAIKYYNQAISLQDLNMKMQKEVNGLVDYD